MSTSVAWAAGLFDGEGCIAVAWTRRTNHFALQLRLSMTDRAGVERFREIVSAGTLRRLPGRAPRRDAWVWTVTRASDASTVLHLLWPFLVVKAAETELAIDFLETVGRPKKYLIFKALRALKSKPGNRGRA